MLRKGILLGLAIWLSTSEAFLFNRRDEASYEEVRGDMPFKIISEIKNTAPPYSLNLTSQYVTNEPLEITFTYLPMAYEDTDIQDVFGYPISHQCNPTEGQEYAYSCVSVLQVDDYRDLQREMGTVLGLKNDEGIFYTQRRIYYDGMLEHLPTIPYTSNFPATNLLAHPPPKVYFTPGQDAVLEWEIASAMLFIIEIDRITFSQDEVIREELLDLGSFEKPDHYAATIGRIHLLWQTNEIPEYDISSSESGEEGEQMEMYTARMTIEDATAEDAGLYTFQVGVTAFTVKTELVVSGESTAYPEQPIVAKFDACQLRNNLLTSDEDMCIECLAFGQNIEDVRLIRDGQIVTSSEGRTFSRVGMLPEEQKASYVVPSPAAQDSGNYVCEVTSTDGRTASQSLDVLFIGEKPAINLRFVEEDDVKILLECDATDRPGLNSHMVFQYYERIPENPGSLRPTILDASHDEFDQFIVVIKQLEGTSEWRGTLIVDKISGYLDDSQRTFGCGLVNPIGGFFDYVRVEKQEQ